MLSLRRRGRHSAQALLQVQRGRVLQRDVSEGTLANLQASLRSSELGSRGPCLPALFTRNNNDSRLSTHINSGPCLSALSIRSKNVPFLSALSICSPQRPLDMRVRSTF